MFHVHLVSGMYSMRLRGLVHPFKDEIDPGLAVGVSGGGELYVSKKTASALTLVRSFVAVRDEDYFALRDWYTSVSEGSQNPFLFIDGDGSSYTVRWIDTLLDWQKDAENRWSGSMSLRVEDFEP